MLLNKKLEKIDLILIVYGKVAFNKNINIKYQGEEFSSWYIEGIDDVRGLLDLYSRDEILMIYYSGI